VAYGSDRSMTAAMSGADRGCPVAGLSYRPRPQDARTRRLSGPRFRASKVCRRPIESRTPAQLAVPHRVTKVGCGGALRPNEFCRILPLEAV
jgi:hypothetical protein